MHNLAFFECRLFTFQILIPYLAHKSERLWISGIQHLAAALIMSHRPLVNEVRTYTREGKRVTWSIKLRHYLHSAFIGKLHKFTELALGVVQILSREGCSISPLDIAFHAEC